MRSRLALVLALVALSASAQEPEARSAEAAAVGPAPGEAVEESGSEAQSDAEAPLAVEPAAPATAPARAAAGPSRRAAVLVVAATEADEAAADALTEVLIGAIASRGGVEIVGKEELQALLHQGEARSLECVSSLPCLGRLGVQLRVAEAVVGTLAHDDGRWTFDLTRLDVRAGSALGRVFREVQGEVADVAAAMLDGVRELYEPRPQPARLRFAANVPARVLLGDREVGVFRQEALWIEDLEPGSVHMRAEPLVPGYRPWSRSLDLDAGADVRVEASLERVPSPPPAVPPPEGPRLSPLLWVGAGLAAAGGAVALGFGLRSRRNVPGGANRAMAVAFVEDRRRDATIANVGLATMAAGAAVGIVGLVLSDFRGGRGLRAGLAPRPGGAQLTLEGAL